MKISGVEMISEATNKTHRNFIVLCVLVFLANTMDVPLSNIEVIGRSATPEFWSYAMMVLMAFAASNYFFRWLADVSAYVGWFRSTEIEISAIDEMGDESYPRAVVRLLKYIEGYLEASTLNEDVMGKHFDQLGRVLDTAQTWDRIDLTAKLLVFGWFGLVPAAALVLSGTSFIYGFGMDVYQIAPEMVTGPK